MNLDKFREALIKENYIWRKHIHKRLAEREISQTEVISALIRAELVEEYPEDMPYPSALFLGWVEGKAIHIVASFDEETSRVFLITTYYPDEVHFENDRKTRKKK